MGILKRILRLADITDTAVGVYGWFSALGGLVLYLGALIKGMDPLWWLVIAIFVAVAILALIVLVLHISDWAKFTYIKRIPLNGWLNRAVKKGWIVCGEETGHIYDVVDGLRQAGRDGVVDIWGRKKEGNDPFTEDNLLDLLPKDYWLNHEICAFSCMALDRAGYESGIVRKNLNIETDNTENGGSTQLYADIHVDKKQTDLWFKDKRDHENQPPTADQSRK